MRKKDIEKLILDMSGKLAAEDDLSVCDVEYVKEAGYYYLRIYINKEEGVSLDDCQILSRKLSKQLDELDPIEENYFLEVSSLGLDRPLKTLELVKESIEKNVDVSFYKKVNDSKKYTGKIISVNDNLIKLEISENEYLEFKFEEASKIRLSVEL